MNKNTSDEEKERVNRINKGIESKTALLPAPFERMTYGE
jgi:hypothetical protein